MSSMLQNLSTADISVCANCGKEGNSDEIKNICNKCKQVKYCNAACKKKHRSKHKKECEGHIRLAAEHAAKLHDIELFKQPRPKEDCPICFIRLPTFYSGAKYYVSYGYRHLKRDVDTRHAAEKLYVVDAVMHLYMITRVIKLIIKSVHFAGFRMPKQMKRQIKEK